MCVRVCVHVCVYLCVRSKHAPSQMMDKLKTHLFLLLLLLLSLGHHFINYNIKTSQNVFLARIGAEVNPLRCQGAPQRDHALQSYSVLQVLIYLHPQTAE